MKIHQAFIILCHFILLVCYTSNSKAQTVGGAGVSYEGPAAVNESDQFSLTCSTSSKFVVFKWRRNGVDVNFGNEDSEDSQAEGPNGFVARKLTIKSALCEHDGNYKCTSESEDYGHNLTVTCAPDRKLKAEFSVPEGKPCQNTTLAPENCRLGVLYKKFSVRCFKDGTPLNDSMTIGWYYLTEGDKSQYDKYMPVVGTGDGRITVSEGLLEFTHLGPTDTNFYSCRATTKKSTSQKENLVPVLQEIFEIQALPQVSAPLKDMTVIEDNQINVTCTVYGKASHVVWKFGEKELLNGTDNRVRLDTFKNVSGASLLISRANMTDRGMYNCTAVSYYGNSSESVGSFVRIKSKYAALGPFLGICAEVIILCTIILIYEKKRDKTELEESDTDQGPETKSSPDHGQDSVRYRK